MINSLGLKLLVGNSAITVQYLDLHFRFFECKFKVFHIYNLNPKGRATSIFKRNTKRKAYKRSV